MMRILLSVTVFALGITVAAAQDPIKERKDLMRGMSDQAKIGGAMAKGDEPFEECCQGAKNLRDLRRHRVEGARAVSAEFER